LIIKISNIIFFEWATIFVKIIGFARYFMKLEVQIKMNPSLYLRDPEQSELGKNIINYSFKQSNALTSGTEQDPWNGNFSVEVFFFQTFTFKPIKINAFIP
jgi:hypothetical protein